MLQITSKLAGSSENGKEYRVP